MEPWWPTYARRAWTSIPDRHRIRALVLLTHLRDRFDGAVIGQTRLIESLKADRQQSYGVAVRTVHRLVGLGLLRRKRIGRQVVLWIPDHLLDPSRPAHIEDLAAAGAIEAHADA